MPNADLTRLAYGVEPIREATPEEKEQQRRTLDMVKRDMMAVLAYFQNNSRFDPSRVTLQQGLPLHLLDERNRACLALDLLEGEYVEIVGKKPRKGSRVTYTNKYEFRITPKGRDVLEGRREIYS